MCFLLPRDDIPRQKKLTGRPGLRELQEEVTIQTSRITLPRFIFWELSSAIKDFTPHITPKDSQRINRRNKFHLGYTRNSLGNSLYNPRGPNFGETSPLIFWIFASGFFFPFSPGFMYKSVRKSHQNVEKIARFPGGEKGAESCHACGCHGYFGPDKSWKETKKQSRLKFSVALEKFTLGVAQTVFLADRVFVPCHKGAVLAKAAKMTNLHSNPLRTKGFAPQTRENDENDENHSGKGMV